MRSALPLIFLLSLLVAACGDGSTGGRLDDLARWEDLRLFPAGDSLQMISREGNASLRASAARSMGRIGDFRARPLLEERLRDDKRAEVRREAAFALGILGDPDAAPALIERLSVEQDIEVLGQTALAVGRLGVPGSGGPVIGLLAHDHPQVRELAVESLALLADSTSYEALVQAVGDPIESVAWRAAYALERLPGQAQTGVLIEATRDSRREVAYRAVRALGRMKATDPAAARACAEAYGEHPSDWALRCKAVESLGRLEAKAESATLLTALQDESFHVRDAAAASLGQVKASDAIPALLDATKDEVVQVRRSAWSSLATLLEGRGARLLAAGLEDPSPYVRAEVARVLGETEDPWARDRLLEALDEEHPAARAGLARGLGALGDALAPREILLKMASEDEPTAAVMAIASLYSLGDSTAGPILGTLLDEPRAQAAEEIRGSLYRAYGELGVVPMIPRLQEALENEANPRIRVTAQRALVALLDETSAAALPSEDEVRKQSIVGHRPRSQPERVRKSDAQFMDVETPRGSFRIEFFGEDAPQYVETMAQLGETGRYDGLVFHRVVPDFVIQGGDPWRTGNGDAGWTVRSEWSQRRFERGTVGIAHSGKDTGCCQFFVCHTPQPHLEARYTIVGEVVDGLEVIDRIQQGDSMDVEITRGH